MVGRTTRCSRIDTLEAECSQVEFIDENVDHPNWVFFGDVIVLKTRREWNAAGVPRVEKILRGSRSDPLAPSLATLGSESDRLCPSSLPQRNQLPLLPKLRGGFCWYPVPTDAQLQPSAVRIHELTGVSVKFEGRALTHHTTRPIPEPPESIPRQAGSASQAVPDKGRVHSKSYFSASAKNATCSTPEDPCIHRTS